MTAKKESLEEFLARGGKIEKCTAVESQTSRTSRFKEHEIWRHNHGMKARVRVDNYKKKTGGKLPPDMKMYLGFARKFGV